MGAHIKEQCIMRDDVDGMPRVLDLRLRTFFARHSGTRNPWCEPAGRLGARTKEQRFMCEARIAGGIGEKKAMYATPGRL